MAAWRRMTGTVLWVCLLAALTGAGATSAQTETGAAGCVVSVHGAAVVERQGQTLPASEGLPLLDGDTLIVPDGGRCSGLTPAGDSFALDGPARMALTLRDQTLDGVRGWLARQIYVWTGKSRRQALTTRGMRTWELRADPCRPLFPTAGGAVRPAAARFCWATVPGLEEYVLAITTEDGPVSQRTVRGNTALVEDLQPGKRYLWHVLPALAGWPTTEHWYAFRTLTVEEEDRVRTAIAQLGDLEGAVLLMAMGLQEEAVHRLDAAHELEPESASILRWRAEALSAMGLHEDAARDLRDAAGLP